jgi:NADPH:quinone reductase-like Zn-dependent oxidoreductase
VVGIAEVPKPTPRPDELLVAVSASTVNRTDCAYRQGKPFLARAVYGPVKPRATILGCEFAGRVEAIGSEVTAFTVGDRVFGYNEGRFGGHAEFLVMKSGGSVAIMPANSTYRQVAPGSEGAHYALSMINAAKIRGGQRVLINGATGGIGSAAVQLVRTLGAEVTATCGPAHTELLLGLGADRVIDYTATDFTQDGGTYDVIIDAVGKSSFGACKRLLAARGIYLSSELGRHAQNPVLALVTPMLGGRKVLFPIPRHNQSVVRHLGALIESGDFAPLVDRQFPMDQIVDAYRYVETGQKIGNVVIDVDL